MASRGLTGDVVKGLKGWKIQYGFKGFSSMGPSTVITKPLRSPRVEQALAATVGKTMMPTLFNLDAFENPQDGKRLMNQDMAAFVQWTKLDYIQKMLDSQERRLRALFKKAVLPRDVETIFITLVFRLNVKKYPVLKKARLSVSIPVKGDANRWIKFSMYGGEV